MLGGKDGALVFGRKLAALIEHHLQRGVVRLNKHVGHDHLILQLRVLAVMAWILISTYVVPGPAVESAFLDIRDLLRREVMSQSILLVDRSPKLARVRMDCNTHGVSNARRVDAQSAAVGGGRKNIRAVVFDGVIVGVVHVGMRSDGYVHRFSVVRESNI